MGLPTNGNEMTHSVVTGFIVFTVILSLEYALCTFPYEEKLIEENAVHQVPIEHYVGIAKYWNNLDWAMAFHIDDVVDPSQINLALLKSQPLTLGMTGYEISCPKSTIDDYHVEYASHSAIHEFCGKLTYYYWYFLISESVSLLERKTDRISPWSDKCISFIIPGSDFNMDIPNAAYDAGIRILGLGYSGDIENNFMLLKNKGGKPDRSTDWRDSLMKEKKNGNFTDFCFHVNHPSESFDLGYLSFIQNETTGWHCTWGEYRSYCWYKNHITLLSQSTTKYMVRFDDNDQRIWSVPVTFIFNISGWNGTIKADGSTITKDLSHQQIMTEGYRYEGNLLFVSIRVHDSSIIEIIR